MVMSVLSSQTRMIFRWSYPLRSRFPSGKALAILSVVRLALTLNWLVLTQKSLFCQETILPPGETSPVLRLETGGPRSYISGVAFSPDGQHLYATGWDKAVQVWNLRDGQQFEYSSGATLRIPTGAGPFGEMNGLALSQDGQWLAVAGQGQPREVPGERTIGWVLPAGNLTQTSQLDNGMIYVFNTSTRITRLLRGHRGPIQSLTFVQGGPPDLPRLVSIAEERTDDSSNLVSRVRCWDIQSAKEIGILKTVPTLDGKNWESLPGLKGFRPGISAWSTGSGLKQIRVALALGDDQFRIWNVETGQVANTKTNPNLLCVLPVAGRTDQLLTGAHAEIGHWSIPQGQPGQLAAINRQNFQLAQIETVNGRSQNLPSAVALIPARNGAAAQVAFVITRYLPNGGAEYRLLITTAAPPFRTIREVALPWRGDIRQPAIAASPDGARLAVAGNERNEIEIHLLSELLNGNVAPQQVLGSVGLAFQDVGFVQSDGNWGIQLATTRRDANGRFPAESWVFDINQRRLAPVTDNWRPANAVADGWSANISGPSQLTVQRPAKPALQLSLIDGHNATGFAFCPPSPHCPVPLIAVASQVRGLPLLQLFNGDSGDALRWCVGHTERIRAVSFSTDGRMLASVADDRTVSIWTTTDLVDRTLGKHGRYAGVTIHKPNQVLIVTAAPTGYPLQPGDEIVSVLRANGEKAKIDTVKDFYKTAHDRRPGELIEVSIRRGGQVLSVQCAVGQAIDEVKPLFSLFLTPSKNKGDWEWIGWHPLGNFDAHGDRIEQLLGWHFNTGEPEHPARFAAIGEYRDAFYRFDLLKNLVELQKLPPAPEVRKDPTASIWLRHLDGTPVGTRDDNVALINVKQIQLVADVAGIAENQLQAIDFRIDGDAAVAMAKSDAPMEWVADLSKIDWKRGLRRIAVRLKTADREMTATERVQYLPPAPTINWVPDPTWQSEISAATITTTIAIESAVESFQAQLLLQRPGQAQATELKSWQNQQTLNFTENIPLEPGENRLQLVAWNSGASPESREAETSRKVIVIRRSSPPMAPRISISEVRVVSDQDEPKVISADGDTYRTASRQLQIRGEIVGQAAIGNAKIFQNASARDLTAFQTGTTREFRFDETLTLQPGNQFIAIQSAIGDASNEKRVEIIYQPPAPAITSMKIDVQPTREFPKTALRKPSAYFANYDEASATLTAQLQGRLEYPYRVAVLVNNSPVGEAEIAIDRSQSALHVVKAKIPLVGGKNSVVLLVSNEFSRGTSLQSSEIDFLRPPEILNIQAESKLVERPLDLICRIRSVIPLRSTKIIVDNADEIAGTFTPVAGSPDEYLLRADRTGLPEGEHVLRIDARNDDAACVEPGIHRVTVEKAPAKPPVLALVAPAATNSAITVSSRRLTIQYIVQSSEPVIVQTRSRGAEIIQSGDQVPTDGTPGVIAIDLVEGINDIELTARNSGGFSDKQTLKVSCVPFAATVEIVSIDGQRPKLRNDGTGQFEKSTNKSRVPLRGRIRSKDPFEPGRPMRARIWVNGFKLPTAEVAVDRNDLTIGTFTSDLTLNRAANDVKVEIYGDEKRIASELGCTNTLTIKCDKPETRQDLYLVLMGTGTSDALRDRAQTMLKAKIKSRSEGSQEIWVSDVFPQILVFEAMNVHPATAQHRLLNVVRVMNSNLKTAAKTGTQAIVMVYFQGKIMLSNEDFSFVTSDAQPATAKSVTGRGLETNLTNSYGAHLLCLDLTQNSSNLTASDIWPKAPNLGIIVTNWRGEQKQPGDTRLIAALERSLPQTRIIRDLSSKIGALYQSARQQFPEQIETVDRLQDLQELPFGTVE